MSKKIVLSLLILIPFALKAQLNISTQLPPSGFIQTEQLWNITLINNANNAQEVTLKMNLQDAQTGEVVLSANSGNVLISKGVTVIKSGDIQPIIYNYNFPSMDRNFLPIGAYMVCYQVYESAGEQPVLLAEDCIPINIDPLSPPILIAPADQTVLSDPYPKFSWIPPSPYGMFSNLNYELRLTEVLEAQSPSDALEYNTPAYIQDNILQPSSFYPSSFQKLDTGKLYAWQVIARNGSNYAAKTDIWTFSIAGNPSPKVKQENESYITLLQQEQGLYAVHKDVLHVKFYSYEKQHTASLLFIDPEGNTINSINIKVIPGENRFDFDIRKPFTTGKVYKLLLQENRKNYYLKFVIK